MILGLHTIIYSADAEADRAFFRDILGFPALDAGEGWLIFAAPPTELAFHPAEKNGKHEICLMTDNVKAEITRLTGKGILCSPIADRGWGVLTTVKLPGGGDPSLYEPRHPLAHGKKS